jgi:phosphoribosylanthranilate isomerase
MLTTEPDGFDALHVVGPVVKICGITQPGLAVTAAAHGAAMIGLVFAPSRRHVSPDLAKEISSAVHSAGTRALMVGVFVNEEPRRIREIAGYAGLDVVQLSGDEPDSDVIDCSRYRPVIKAVRFPAGTAHDHAVSLVRRYMALGLGGWLRLLVDTYHPSAYGGTGQATDWLLASSMAAHAPLILAGGLHAGNVEAAVRTVRPWGVDVSSGVERDGAKDPDLISDFVRAARTAPPANLGYGPHREEHNQIW